MTGDAGTTRLDTGASRGITWLPGFFVGVANLVLQLQRPVYFTKQNGVPDMLRLSTGMGFMAGFAGPAFFFSVNMQVVKVPGTVAKICQGSGFLFFHCGSVMTGITEFEEVTLVASGIEFSWIVR